MMDNSDRFTVKGSIANDPRINKSLQRLAQLGFRGELIEASPDWVYLAISNESVIEALVSSIKKNITYPKVYIEIDKQLGFVIIHFWRGEMPTPLQLRAFRREGK